MGADLTGRVALVTGGNGGIGLGMATALAEAVADIAIWGTNPAKNDRVRLSLEKTGRRISASICDVRHEDQVEAAFGATVAELGKVDAVFANASISPARVEPFTAMTLDEWRHLIAVNLDGAFLTLREPARHLVARGDGGALVAVSSTSSVHGAPRNRHYAASKTALLALIRGLAVELARHGIRCNTLVPGWTDTDLVGDLHGTEKFVVNTTSRTPVRRWGLPDDFGPGCGVLGRPHGDVSHRGRPRHRRWLHGADHTEPRGGTSWT